MTRAAILMAIVAATAGWPAAAHAQDHGTGHGGPAPAPSAPADGHTVTITNRAFSPARVTALAGDTVTWRNDDLVVHNVSASGGAIFSGPLHRGGRFAHRFETVGSHPYLCTLHPFMKGQVDVHAALLSAGAGPVLAGEAVALHGRATEAGPVTLERRSAGEGSFSPVASATAGPDGRFHLEIRPAATASYRAATAQGVSAPVTVSVATALRVRVSTRRARRFTRLRVDAPGAGGARATVQLYSRERFTWIEARRVRLDRSGRASLRLRAGLRYHARVVVARADGTLLGVSARVRLPR